MAVKRTIIISAETKAAQKSVDDLTEQLEIQDKVIQKLTEDQAFYEEKLASASKSNLAAQKFYNDKLRETNRELTKEQKARRTLTEEQKVANKTLKETVKEQDKLTGVVGLVDKATGGAITSMRGFYRTILDAVKGMNLFKIAFLASGIGLLLTAVTSLIAAFKRSEAGQEKFQIAMAAIGAVTNQVMDAFASLGEAIIDAVTNPMESIKSLGKGLLNFIINPYKSIIGVVKGAKDSVTDFIEETKTEISAMTEITKARQKAHHIDRALKTERAEADRKINDIRLQAEDRVNNNATQRIALLKEAQRLEEEITQKEIISQKIKIKAQADEMALGKTTIEDKDKLAEMQAKLIQLDTKKLRSQRLLQTQITTAQNEEQAIKDKKIADDKIKTDKAEADEKTRLERIKAIQDEFAQKVKEEEAVKEEEKAILEKEKELLALEELNATEEQKAAIIAYWDGKIQEGKDKDRADQKKKDDKDAKEKKDLEKRVANAKLNIAKNTMALIGEIAGEGSKVGKAMAIGQATISGYQGVQNAYSTAQESPITAVFPAYPIIQAGLAGAFAAVNISKISKTKPSGSSGTSGLKSTAVASAASPNVSSIVAQTPSFNILGTSGTNQIASALGDQPPVQAFVVSQDVTTSQSLQNNIIQSASLG